MTLITPLAWALVCAIAALICWRGVRMKEHPGLAVVAAISMAILFGAAWNSLSLLNVALQAYGMGVRDELAIPGSIWDLGALAVVVKWAPLWLLGGTSGSAQ